jgi:hypothetical protein
MQFADNDAVIQNVQEWTRANKPFFENGLRMKENTEQCSKNKTNTTISPLYQSMQDLPKHNSLIKHPYQ